MDNTATIERALALVTVRYGEGATLDDVWTVARRHGARIVDAVSGAATVEAAGAPSVERACAEELAEVGDCEVARTAALEVPRLEPAVFETTSDDAGHAERGAGRVA